VSALQRVAWFDDDESGEPSEAWHYAGYSASNERPAAYVLAHFAAPPDSAPSEIDLPGLRAAHHRALGHAARAAAPMLAIQWPHAEEERALGGMWAISHLQTTLTERKKTFFLSFFRFFFQQLMTTTTTMTMTTMLATVMSSTIWPRRVLTTTTNSTSHSPNNKNNNNNNNKNNNRLNRRLSPRLRPHRLNASTWSAGTK
jgi:hypothetical protein